MAAAAPIISEQYQLTASEVFAIQKRNNYTQSQGSRSQSSGLLNRNTAMALNQTHARSEESADNDATTNTELHMRSRKIESTTPVLLNINDDDYDEIMIGDSTVEVVNSPHEVYADK
jgi:hypothetical protein